MALLCGVSEGGLCYDETDSCKGFAEEGKCTQNALHQYANFCKRSCGLCSKSSFFINMAISNVSVWIHVLCFPAKLGVYLLPRSLQYTVQHHKYVIMQKHKVDIQDGTDSHPSSVSIQHGWQSCSVMWKSLLFHSLDLTLPEARVSCHVLP